MKDKIIHYNANSKTGVSTITIQNKYGHFTGEAFCCPEDLESFSQYAGFRYAENRAAAKFAKFRYKQEKIKLQTIQNLIKDLNHRNAFIPLDIQRTLKLKLRDYSQSMSDWQNIYTYLKDSVKKQDKERQEVVSWTKKDK